MIARSLYMLVNAGFRLLRFNKREESWVFTMFNTQITRYCRQKKH